jgi:hypothetical protein
LSILHCFDELVNKITARCGTRVVEVETCRPRLRECPTPVYPFDVGSPKWASFPTGWPADGPLDKPDLMSFPLGVVPCVQTPDTYNNHKLAFLSTQCVFWVTAPCTRATGA